MKRVQYLTLFRSMCSTPKSLVWETPVLGKDAPKHYFLLQSKSSAIDDLLKQLRGYIATPQRRAQGPLCWYSAIPNFVYDRFDAFCTEHEPGTISSQSVLVPLLQYGSSSCVQKVEDLPVK
jgi:hypothetical protein